MPSLAGATEDQVNKEYRKNRGIPSLGEQDIPLPVDRRARDTIQELRPRPGLSEPMPQVPPDTLGEPKPGEQAEINPHRFFITVDAPQGTGFWVVPGWFPGQKPFDPAKPQTFTDEHRRLATVRAWQLAAQGVRYPQFEDRLDAIQATLDLAQGKPLPPTAKPSDPLPGGQAGPGTGSPARAATGPTPGVSQTPVPALAGPQSLARMPALRPPEPSPQPEPSLASRDQLKPNVRYPIAAGVPIRRLKGPAATPFSGVGYGLAG